MLLDLNLVPAGPGLRGLPPAQAPAPACAEITIVTPTYNERGNLDELVKRVRTAMAGVRWELVIVDDDSPDGTVKRAHALHRQDPRVRVIRRVNRRGLSSACVEGMLSSSAPFVAVIDADLQHDPSILADMLGMLRSGAADLVCASRNVAGGTAEGWSEHRAAASRLATWAANSIKDVRLTDPMSGYFAVRRDVVERVAPSLACVGFKVMLDIVLAAGPGLRVAEVPLVFGFRERGDSKLSPRVVWDYAMMLAEHRMGGALSAAALSAAAVALVGLHANLFTLWLLADLYGAGLTAAQTSGALAACVTIYAVTEALAYRRRGSWRWYLGLPPFIASCAFGILANVLLTSWLSAHGAAWPLAGALGAAFGMAWNYGAIGRHGWKR